MSVVAWPWPSGYRLTAGARRLLVAMLLAALPWIMQTNSWATTGEERAAAAGHGLVGTAAPRLLLQTIDGKQIDLGKLYGRKGVYLKFWATWCVPCREQMPHLERTFQTEGPDLAVIAVNAGFNDTLEDVRAYRRSVGLTMPIVIDDGRLGAAFNLRVTPQHIVIGRDGKILYVGHLADERLEAALRAARVPAAGSGSLVSASVVSGTGQHSARHQYGVGERAPAISASTLDGDAFQMRAAGEHRPTVLAFISPWCESYLAKSRPQMAENCRAVRERLDALAGDSRVRWLGIASGLWATKEDLSGYRAQYRVAIPLTLDESGELFRTFGVARVPTLLIIDGAGCIAGRVEGADTKALDELASMSTRSDCVQK